MNGFIYVLTFSNGKRYVGQTTQSVKHRFWGHRSGAKNSIRDSRVLVAWRKYGEPKCETLGEFPADALDVTEAVFISLLKTLAPNGYNLEPGGNEGFSHPETRAKISAAGKGRKHSIETREKIAASNRTTKAKPEYSARRIATAERNKAVVWTPELRAKVGAKSVGRVRSAESLARQGESIRRVRAERFWSSRP